MNRHYYCRNRCPAKRTLHAPSMWLGLIILFAILAFGGIVYFRHEADKRAQELKDSNAATNLSMPSTEVASRYSREEILITDLSGGQQTVASREIEDKVFRHTVVGHLNDLPEGSFYEGWLLREEPFDFFSTGPMDLNADGTYALIWEGPRGKDFLDYTRVIITRESNDGDPGPSSLHVLEGEF